MGKYINTTTTKQELPALGKAAKLIEDGATLILDKPSFQDNLVCVANNGFFECAAYCHSEDEFKAFVRPDGRPKIWLIYPHAKDLAH